jgi:hypothetical protein
MNLKADGNYNIYQRILRQKHATVKRLASNLSCAEMQLIYENLVRNQAIVLADYKNENLRAKAFHQLCLAFCSSLHPMLFGPISELLWLAICSAIDDIESKEAELLEQISLDFSSVPQKQIASKAKKFSSVSVQECIVRLSARMVDATTDILLVDEASSSARLADAVISRFYAMIPQLKRILFTETCSAYNFTQLLCYSALAEKNQELMIRWCERINDEDGSSLHKSVSEDSKRLHGQIVRPREEFVSEDGSWFHPPNRPYDHAVMMPWHPVFEDIFVWKQQKKQGKADGD